MAHAFKEAEVKASLVYKAVLPAVSVYHLYNWYL